MNVDEHAALQAREYLEQEVIHVAVELAHMRRVDEQDVVSLEPFEFGHRHVLQPAGE